MHIPDGYLGPQTYITMYVAMLPLWRRALIKLKQSVKKNFSRLAVAAAFVFVLQMFNVPIPGGTTGHAFGGTVVALIFGPWLALTVVSLVLLIQAFIFGDGGITAFGANSFAMAFVQPFTAVLIYRLITGSLLFTSNNVTTLSRRQKLGAFLAGHLSASLAATVVGVLVGLQPLVAQLKGKPLYAPYPLTVTVPAMALSHLLLFGLLEGGVTTLVLAYLAREVKTNSWLNQLESKEGDVLNLRKALLWLLILALLTPLGLLAQGTAFGEWSSEELKKSLGFIPAGLAKLESFWSAPFAKYSISFVNETVSYIISALLGIGFLFAVFKLIAYFLSGQKEGK